MDLLSPELKWIENRCYRVLRIKDGLRNADDDDGGQSTYIQDDDDYDPDLPILHQGNIFYITIYAPAQLLKHVRGYKGKMLKALEQYGAKVNVPDSRNAAAGITISGSTKKVVSDTYHRVEDLVKTFRFRTEATHFISLPVNFPEIKESFLKLKDEILAKYKGVRGVDESIFQIPDKLHVTIVPLILLDERDKQNAIAAFKKCTDNILKQLGAREFVVKVNGIEYMNDDPAEVDVLYAKLKELDNDDRLQIIADTIVKEFVNADLSKFQHDKVKLHITVMNTLFRDKLENQDDSLERVTFDARSILKDYSDYDFGQITVSEIHISVRYSTATSDGYYVALHKIKLNP